MTDNENLRNTAKRGDQTLDEHLTTVCSLCGNKIRRLDTFISDVEMLNAFFVFGIVANVCRVVRASA